MSKRVLVVDDEKLIVKGIKFSLEQDGMVLMTGRRLSILVRRPVMIWYSSMSCSRR